MKYNDIEINGLTAYINEGYVIRRHTGETQRGYTIYNEAYNRIHGFGGAYAFNTTKYGWHISLYVQPITDPEIICQWVNLENLWPQDLHGAPETIKVWQEEFKATLDRLEAEELKRIKSNEVTVDGNTFWYDPVTYAVWTQHSKPYHIGYLQTDGSIDDTPDEVDDLLPGEHINPVQTVFI